MPKISIIVPVYKVEKYIRKCIDSILASSFTDFELLLIDDGSPDNSGRICDDFAERDSRVKVFHKENGGVSSARNVGLENVSGEWITFIDSDDFISPLFLEGLYRPILEGYNLTFVQGGFSCYENEKPSSVKYKYENYYGEDAVTLFLKVFGYPFSKLFKAENIEHWDKEIPLRFDEKMRVCEDLAFVLDYLLKNKRFAIVEEFGYFYRKDNACSIMNTKKRNSYEIEKHSYNHLRNSILSVIECYALPRETFYRHFSSHLSCMNMVFVMYWQTFTRKERLLNLKNDLLEIDYKLIPYVSFKIRYQRFLANLLFNRHYLIFDAITYSLVQIKKRIIE